MILLLVLFMNVLCVVHGKYVVDKVEAETIRLRLRSGSNNEPGIEGDSTWYCKRIRETEDYPHNHVNGHAASNNNIYFVQPHSKKYKHEVVVDGLEHKNPNTTIYVLPSKHEHEIELLPAENGPAVSKPSFFFLKNHPLDINKSVSASVSIGAPPATTQYNSPAVPPARIRQNYRQTRNATRHKDMYTQRK